MDWLSFFKALVGGLRMMGSFGLNATVLQVVYRNQINDTGSQTIETGLMYSMVRGARP